MKSRGGTAFHSVQATLTRRGAKRAGSPGVLEALPVRKTVRLMAASSSIFSAAAWGPPKRPCQESAGEGSPAGPAPGAPGGPGCRGLALQ